MVEIAGQAIQVISFVQSSSTERTLRIAWHWTGSTPQPMGNDIPTHFEVYRGIGTSPKVLIASVPYPKTTFNELLTIPPGTLACYQVVAMRDTTESAWTNEVCK